MNIRWLWWALTTPVDNHPIEVERRHYEWDAFMYCSLCKRTWWHRLIEWLPDRSVTAECQVCGYEEVVVDGQLL